MDSKTNNNESCLAAAVRGNHAEVINFLEKNEMLVHRVCHDISKSVIRGCVSLNSLKSCLPLELWELCCDFCRVELLKLDIKEEEEAGVECDGDDANLTSDGDVD